MYIAPIRKSIKIEDGYLNSDSDTDEELIISTTKIEDPIVISDDEADIRVNTQQNSLSVNEFRLNMLNKLRLEHQILEGSFTLIIIRSRCDICDEILNWINDASIYDVIKNPIIDILDEE